MTRHAESRWGCRATEAPVARRHLRVSRGRDGLGLILGHPENRASCRQRDSATCAEGGGGRGDKSDDTGCRVTRPVLVSTSCDSQRAASVVYRLRGDVVLSGSVEERRDSPLDRSYHCRVGEGLGVLCVIRARRVALLMPGVATPDLMRRSPVWYRARAAQEVSCRSVPYFREPRCPQGCTVHSPLP